MRIQRIVAVWIALTQSLLAADHSGNLVQNPGYETGTFESWVPSGGASVTSYSWACHTGTNGVWVFAGPGGAYQDMSIAAFSNAIDHGHASVYGGAYMIGFNALTLSWQMIDGQGIVLASNELSHTYSGDYTSFQELSFTSTPPQMARSIRVQLDVRTDDIFADTGWDDAFLVVSYVEQPAFGALSVAETNIAIQIDGLSSGEVYDVEYLVDSLGTNWTTLKTLYPQSSSTNLAVDTPPTTNTVLRARLLP